MSPSTEQTVSVHAPRDVETMIIDHAFRLVHHGVGDFTRSLAPGIYKFKFRRGSAIVEQLTEVSGTAPVTIEAPELESRSAVPLRMRRGAQDHLNAAHDLSRQTHETIGSGSRIFIFSRRTLERRTVSCDVAGGLSLRYLDGTMAVDLQQKVVRDAPGGSPYAACSIALDPGAYRLRLAGCDEPLEQIVIASPNWQTQVFLLVEPSRDPSLAPPPPLASASVLMCRGGFEPDNEMLRLADSALTALKQKHATMPRELLTDLLEEKFDYPMLGIYGAHALLLSQSGEDPLFRRVLSVLEDLVPGHPDVAALRIAAGAQGVEVRWPPMLRTSWNVILAATFNGHAWLTPGSLASRVPAVLLDGTPWLIWSPDSLHAAGTAVPRDVSADLSEIEKHIDAFAETSPAVQLNAPEEELFSYLSRRSRLQKHSTRRSAGSTSLNDKHLAAAFGTTLANVQTTVSGLAGKLLTIQIDISDNFRLCIDVAPTPADVNERMALMQGGAWGAGHLLRVRFLDGDPVVHEKVRKCALQWTEYANIRIAYINDGNADVRISFKAGPSWAQLGSYARKVPTADATMNFGWLTPATPDDEYRRVVLHEFGHALGCMHEHQHPAGGIHWNKQAVYAWYQSKLGWNPQQVDKKVFQSYTTHLVKGTGEIDPESIMLYPIDKSLTQDGYSVDWNRELSPMDKKFIRILYPF